MKIEGAKDISRFHARHPPLKIWISLHTFARMAGRLDWLSPLAQEMSDFMALMRGGRRNQTNKQIIDKFDSMRSHNLR